MMQGREQGRGLRSRERGAENQGDVGYGAKGMGLQPSVRRGGGNKVVVS